MGKKLIFLTSCHSTNEEAYARMGSGGLPEGTIIITEFQTKGRGQMGNHWESEAGKNLTFSIVLKPDFLSVSDQFLLTQAISLGILNALREMAPGFSVKWPNDIYHGDKKLGGILIQNVLNSKQIEYAIVGIGININQTKFEHSAATSLAKITGKSHQLSEILGSLAVSIDDHYSQLMHRKFVKLHRSYIDNLYRYGEDHLFKAGEVFSGRIIDVRISGELVLETSRGERAFRFKEIEFL